MSKLQSQIRGIILEELEELFATEDDSESVKLSRDSLDDQVDAFLMRFEKSSILPDEDTEGLSESFRSLSLAALLQEQDAPEAEEEPAGDAPPPPPPPEDEAPPAPEEEVEVGEVEEEVEESKPNIDIDEFTKRVVRLATNADVLLDIKSVIINRALNYILENYNKERLDEMIESLDLIFGIDEDDKDLKQSAPEAPYAVGAWAGGTGGLGGGGGG